MNDDSVGVFIPDSAIVDWHDKMKVRMPEVFPMDEKAFGNDPGHHPYGTKLYDDDHPWINCTVVGSRWQKEEERFCRPGLSSFADYREPHYVILANGELDQIGFFDAHIIGYGWKVVGLDSKVDPRLDLLARAHQKIQNAHSSEEDSLDERSDKEADDCTDKITLPSLNRRIRRTLKILHEVEKGFILPLWNQSVNGHFFQKFFMHSFSPSERELIMSFGGLVTRTTIEARNELLCQTSARKNRCTRRTL